MTSLRRELLNALLIALGILSAGMGLKGFLLSSNFIDGGVTGVSMLLAKITSAPLSIWLPLVNVPFIVIGYRQMGRAFAIRSALAIAGLSGTLAVVRFPDVTHDLLLTAVFGGFFIGAGIGLAVRGGAVLDGTEIAALLISRIALTVLGAAAAADLVFVRALQPTTLTAALMLGAWLLTPYIIGGAWLVMTRRDRRFSAAAAIVTTLVAAGGTWWLIEVIYLHPDAQGAIAVVLTPVYQMGAFVVLVPLSVWLAARMRARDRP